MPDAQNPTDNTAELTRLQAENTALHATLKEHADKLATYADADQKIAQYESKTKGYSEYLQTHVKASYKAAPEWVRAKVKPEEIEAMDPLEGIKNIETLSNFYAEIVAGVKTQYGIKEAATDPTRRAPDAKDKPKVFNSTMDIVNHLTGKNHKE